MGFPSKFDENRDDFDSDIVIFLFLNFDVPRSASYGVIISLLKTIGQKVLPVPLFLSTVQSRGIFTSPPNPAERGLQQKGLKF